MAVYRNVHISFWNDTKVSDDFTPKDKFFYLYLLTNPHTNLCGCYEISEKQIAMETGYTVDAIKSLIKRFTEVHRIIDYSKENKEILLINWSKYNWTESPKFTSAVEKELPLIKTDRFREYLEERLYGSDTVWIPYEYGIDTVSNAEGYGMDTTVSVTDTDTVSDADTVNNTKANEDIIKNIINYLNNKIGSMYRAKTGSTASLINARLNDGFTEDDFKIVIDKKYAEWKGTKFQKFLKPSTLFAPSHFEEYLNQSEGKESKKADNINASRESQLAYLLNSIREDEENENI